MVDVVFAKAFRRHVECPDAVVDAGTVGDALAAYFEAHPTVRSYVLDDVGSVRRHVAVFRNDDQIADRSALTDPIADGDRIHVFQALSGG
ncbi:MAG: MoaD/ThiS family protein [Ilumatobacter sp.]|uniref:MoaD/ThiS family protein n=1 Tax=Ilumatobacter sp. TaxID=1967498 RepID=UPI00260955D5|nr:MoaD/ThiS family protein [Ilumatobacter sp.]MDJ0768106.1 MoaD/ThiS family protein [Ilumatobacter sp.]